MNQNKRTYGFWASILIWSIQIMHMVVRHHVHDDHVCSCSDLPCHNHVGSTFNEIDHHHHSNHSNEICQAPIINGARAEVLADTDQSSREEAERNAWPADMFRLHSQLSFAPVTCQHRHFAEALQEGLIAAILSRGPPVIS